MVAYRMIDWLDWLPKDLYRVGDDGSVWRKFGRKSDMPRWKSCNQRPGKRTTTPYVRLKYKGRVQVVSVPVLVLRAFVGPRPIGCVPYHYPNQENADNRLANLRWSPLNSHQIGKRPNCSSEVRYQERKLCSDDIHTIFSYRESGMSHQAIAELFDVSRTTIRGILQKKVYADVLPEKQEIVGQSSPGRKGDYHSHAKLTSLDIPEIRAKNRAGYGYRRLGREYGVCRTTIEAICTKASWSHIPDEMNDAPSEPS